MSVIEELGAQLTRAAESLPVGEVRLAADRVEAATGLLGYVLHTTSRAIGLTELASATTHLEQAFATLVRAKEHVAAYQAAIGLGGSAGTTAPLVHKKAPEPTNKPARTAERQSPALDDWWGGRIDVITGGEEPLPPREEKDRPPTAPDLLRSVARLVRQDEPKRLRVELHRAGPAVGLRLTALSAPLLRELCTELLQRPPVAADVPELERRLAGRTGRALPGLPPQLPAILLGRACHAEPTAGAHGVPEHPVDSAACGAVLVGGLLAALRRPPESLVLAEENAS